MRLIYSNGPHQTGLRGQRGPSCHFFFRVAVPNVTYRPSSVVWTLALGWTHTCSPPCLLVISKRDFGNHKMEFCRKCQQNLPLDHFTNNGLTRRNCRTCARAIMTKSAKGTEARRLLTCVKQLCRMKQWPEGASWRLSHIEDLLKHAQVGQIPSPRLRIVRVDPTKPMLPMNAKIVCFGLK